jgi:NAD+ diphosphatase
MAVFQPSLIPPAAPADSLWFAFRDDQLLVERCGRGLAIPSGPDPASCGLSPVRRQYLGALEGKPVYSAELPAGTAAPAGMEYTGLRELYGQVDEDLFRLACRAVQVKDWDRNHQFCGRCGGPMQCRDEERSKLCPGCGLVNYPRLSPAVIVAVQREGRILLARSRRFIAVRRYSVLAGFVEPGETLEECVSREIEEETGIRVCNIRYFGSQPWPFPDSLMIAFTADHKSGERRIDDNEIVEAGWFSADDLPEIPGRISIARRLIDDFVERQRRGTAAAL